MTKRVDLTEIQCRVLDFVTTHIDEHDVVPTLQQMTTELGFSAPAQASDHLQRLEAKGWMERVSWRNPRGSFWPLVYSDGRPFLRRKDLLALNAVQGV